MKITITLVHLALVSIFAVNAVPTRFNGVLIHRRSWSAQNAIDNWGKAVDDTFGSFTSALEGHSNQGTKEPHVMISSDNNDTNNNKNNNNNEGAVNNDSNTNNNNNNNSGETTAGNNNDNGSDDSNSGSGGGSGSSSGSDNGSNGSGSPVNEKKVGLAWAIRNAMDIESFKLNKVSWYYSWSATPGWNNAPTDLSFCPMLWGRDTSEFEKHVLNKPNGKFNRAKCVLGINEPEQKSQANMGVSEGCNLMRKYVVPLKEKGYYIVSPATSSAPSGLDWMKDFRSSCSDVWDKIDAVAIHYYDVSTSNFKKYVTKWYKEFQKPIWVTEYACQNFNGGPQCSKGHAQQFHEEMALWFDNQSYVQAYAPFGIMMNMQGVSGTNRLTDGKHPNDLFRRIAN